MKISTCTRAFSASLRAFAIAGTAVAMMALAAPAHAQDLVYSGVRKDVFVDSSGSCHHYVEFEPNVYATSWSVAGPWPHDNPFWGDPSNRAYSLLRAFYQWPGCSPDPTSPSDWKLLAYNASSTIPGDVNGSRKVDIFDYNILVGNFGRTGCGIQGDIDNNCRVDIFDYNILVGNFGKAFEVQRWT